MARAHGLNGEVVVDLSTTRTERLAAGSVLTRAGGGHLEVERASPHLGRWIVAFAGVRDREAAEALRGEVLLAEPLEAEDGELWVHELIGATVVDTHGRDLGRVEAVEANPASDLLVLEGGGLVPLRFVVDREPGRLTVDVPAGLLDL